MCRLTLLPYLLLAVHTFAAMFLMLIQLPHQLLAAGLDHFAIGMTYIGTGG